MCSETTVVIRPMPVAGAVSFTSPGLCAKPNYRGLANPPQCQTVLGLIVQSCVQRGPLDTCLNLLMSPWEGWSQNSRLMLNWESLLRASVLSELFLSFLPCRVQADPSALHLLLKACSSSTVGLLGISHEITSLSLRGTLLDVKKSCSSPDMLV